MVKQVKDQIDRKKKKEKQDKDAGVNLDKNRNAFKSSKFFASMS